TVFLVAGLLPLGFAIGLGRARRMLGGFRRGPVLIGLWGIGLLGAGMFTTDPVSGYASGIDNPLESTQHGRLHDRFSVPGFIALMVACFVYARHFAKRGNRGWAMYSALSGVAFGAAFVL